MKLEKEKKAKLAKGKKGCVSAEPIFALNKKVRRKRRHLLTERHKFREILVLRFSRERNPKFVVELVLLDHF